MTPPRQPATYKDIQRITGLSLATISKYYNGGNVLEKNRVSIEDAATTLGFRVNSYASSLRSGVSRTVGILLPSLQNNFHLSIVVGVEKYLRAEGISVLVTSNEGDLASRSGEALDLLLGRQVDGIICVPAASDVPALTQAISSGIPVVSIDWWEPGLDADSVSLDNFSAGKLAGQHIVDHGHSRIGILAGEETISTMRERCEGFASALAGSGQVLAPGMLSHSPLTVASGYGAMNKLLSSSARPTAVFAANYELTVGALIAVNDSGLRLGADISLVGFDSVELSQVTRPRLTIVTQPVEEIAREAARIMHTRLSARASAPTQRVVKRLPGALSVGTSVFSLHE